MCLSGLEIQRNHIDFVDLALEIEKNLECVLSISFKSIDLTYKSNCHQNSLKIPKKNLGYATFGIDFTDFE